MKAVRQLCADGTSGSNSATGTLCQCPPGSTPTILQSRATSSQPIASLPQGADRVQEEQPGLRAVFLTAL